MRRGLTRHENLLTIIYYDIFYVSGQCTQSVVNSSVEIHTFFYLFLSSFHISLVICRPYEADIK
jgi:hypothetical protein